ncbi:efflux RND transporter permease subunit [Colwellia sp. RSH04]|uniref:efflux RND transporter permease subunit n=1 Tax=Colwellia sp. RSH04 TaxID=2305464 RepID=UPI000E5892DB|nr:efflux RND transporter permease subunit [Colwellia sp. RSH04]RHW77421.1 efflux RND transporter permease subunit [Colwellia sp. RSH04]
MNTATNTTSRFLAYVLQSKLPLFVLILSIIAGMLALKFTPREEEPQIVVPMIDVMVQAPGVSAKQIERLVTTPLEKLLAQVNGVEHIYSVSKESQAVVTLRFHVGESRERSLLNTYNKLHSNTDKIPAIVQHWQVKPIEVDDVPILMLGLWSSDSKKVDDFTLRRLAEEVSIHLQAIENTSEVNITAGRTREIQINVIPEQLAARQLSMQEIVQAIQSSNQLSHIGNIALENESVALQSGDVYRDTASLASTPISVIDGSVVMLKDVATITDGPSEQNHYSWIDFAANVQQQASSDNPLVTLSIAKQAGSNAVSVAKSVHQVMADLQEKIFPESVQLVTLRDYGQTANEKVNNLTTSLAFAVFTVVVFIGVFLGWRSAVVVGLAVPICYGITLALDLAFGYTINRVTLFALILSLGLLVDDPITGVDNIERYLKRKKASLTDNIVGAINEIRVPLFMSTITIVLAFLPLAFITGMMGPYMAPMAFNVPLSVISSTLVAFLVTPWLAAKFIKAPKQDNSAVNTSVEQTGFTRFYRKILTPLLDDKRKGKTALWLVLALFILAAMLPVLRLVPLKLLPYDNKNEVQIIIDMPESASLEQTAAMAKKVSLITQQLPEVVAIASYVGLPSPIDFNGMVRQYYQRHANNLADLRLTLLDKSEREHQSHGIVLRLRALLAPLNKTLESGNINIKVVEVPPGPPVLSTLVAEVYGNEFTDYDALRHASKTVATRLKAEPHVVEVDTTVGDAQTLQRFVTDKTKAALSGVSTQNINQVLNIANQGEVVSYLHLEQEATPLAIKLKLALDERETLSSLSSITVKGEAGIVQSQTPQGIDMAPQSIVSLGELGQFEKSVSDNVIFRKDLKPVVYVTADISGRTPAEVIADITSDLQPAHILNEKTSTQVNETSPHWSSRTFLTSGAKQYWQLPEDINLSFSGEGEWRITIRVFRDMGLAFAFALTAIFIVLRIQTGSAALSGIIMSAIPLTVIGIMPGFFLLNQFGEREIAGAPEPVLFTATAMIGMIALAGIVVRNSLILIEFINQAQQQGLTIKESLLQAGAVRMRPVLLTAGTTLLGNLIITLDPVFSGLAIAIIFGIISSTIFTLLVVPIVYSLVFDKADNKTAHVENQPVSKITDTQKV